MREGLNLEPVNSLIESLTQYLTFQVTVGEPSFVAENSANPTRGQTCSEVTASVTNTAPENRNGSEIVFVGVGLRISERGRNGLSEEAQIFLHHMKNTPPLRNVQSQGYSRWTGPSDPHSDSGDDRFGMVLFPGDKAMFEMEIPTHVIDRIDVQVEGVVSRRHLFHTERRISDDWAKVAIPPIFKAMREIDFMPVSLMSGIPEFGRVTAIEELNKFVETAANAARDSGGSINRLLELSRATPFRDLERNLSDIIRPFFKPFYESCVDYQKAIKAGDANSIHSATELLRQRLTGATDVKRQVDGVILRYESKLKE